MHKNAMKCNKTQSKWYIKKHETSKIIDTFETYQPAINIVVDLQCPCKRVWYQMNEDTNEVLMIYGLDQMVIGIIVGKLNCGGATPSIYQNYTTG
jgi:hypothetical protein